MSPLSLPTLLGWVARKRVRKKDLQNRGSYVVSYPKSGTTWLRVMLGKYVQLLTGRHEDSPLPLFDQFEDIGPQLPLIQFTHGLLKMTAQTGANLTRENLITPYRPYQIVLLVRNIPDVLVSNYWHMKTRGNPPYPDEISEFIRDPIYGVEKAASFLRLWSEGADMVRKFKLIRYEDLRHKTLEEFKRLLKFWQMPIQEDYISQSLAFSEFDNMRKLESDNKQSKRLVYRSSGLPIFGTGDTNKTSESFHVRKGLVGGYAEYLSEKDIRFLKETMRGKIPKMYGYPDGFWDEDPK